MEGMLWKIACVSIMAVMPLFFLPLFTISIADYLCGVESILDNKRFLLAFGLAVYLLALLFAFSRVYIVREAFPSLRAVPIGVYAAIPWVQAIPHLWAVESRWLRYLTIMSQILVLLLGLLGAAALNYLVERRTGFSFPLEVHTLLSPFLELVLRHFELLGLYSRLHC
jgi:hypothetical protein